MANVTMRSMNKKKNAPQPAQVSIADPAHSFSSVAQFRELLTKADADGATDSSKPASLSKQTQKAIEACSKEKGFDLSASLSLVSPRYAQDIAQVIELYQSNSKTVNAKDLRLCNVLISALPLSPYESFRAIAHATGLERSSVNTRLARFLDNGLVGMLEDKPRVGRPRLYNDTAKTIVNLALTYYSPEDLVKDAIRSGVLTRPDLIEHVVANCDFCPAAKEPGDPYPLGEDRTPEPIKFQLIAPDAEPDQESETDSEATAKPKADKKPWKRGVKRKNKRAEALLKAYAELADRKTILQFAKGVENDHHHLQAGTEEYDILPFVRRAQIELVRKLASLSPDDISLLLTHSAWTNKLLSLLVPVSETTLSRYMRKFKIKLRPTGSWCHSNDPKFAEKLLRISEAYTVKGKYDLVLCFDEKPCIQAKEKRRYGKAGKYKNGCRYKKHGTTHLFCILNVRTGAVFARFYRTKTRADVLDFINRFFEAYPEYLAANVAIVLDNISTHKRWEKVDPTWYQEHSNVTLLFTPTCASWVNLVESFFSIYSFRVLRGASFKSVEDLQRRSHRFFVDHNRHCIGYRWTLDVHRYLDQRSNSIQSMLEATDVTPEFLHFHDATEAFA